MFTVGWHQPSNWPESLKGNVFTVGSELSGQDKMGTGGAGVGMGGAGVGMGGGGVGTGVSGGGSATVTYVLYM